MQFNRANHIVQCAIALATVAILFHTASCGGSETTSQQPPRRPMNFRIDADKLGQGFRTNSGLRMWAPRDWPQQSKLDMIAEQERIDSEPFEHHPQVVATFRKAANESRLSVAWFDVALTRTQVDGAVAEREDYFATLGNTVKVARFTNNNCEMDQIIAATDEIVRVVLFVCQTGAPVFLLDFIVPRVAHGDEARAIESTVGALTIDLNDTGPMLEYQDAQ